MTIRILSPKFLTLSIYFLSISSNLWGQKMISLEDLWIKGTFRASAAQSFNWMKDGKHYTDLTVDEKKGVFLVKKYKSSGEEVAVIAEKINLLPSGEQIEIDDYALSPDETKLIINSESDPIYRRSFKANYYIYDLLTKKLFALNDKKEGKISYATFSPDSKKIAYVRDNNLYYVTLPDLKETAITTDGKLNEVINGHTDWVYEEEFEFAEAFFWSPDNKKIAYYRFDETKVKEYNMQVWEGLYPIDYKYKYPKAGEDNSQIEIKCYHLKTAETKNLFSGKDQDIYFPRIKWTKNPEVLCVLKLNRQQSNLDIMLADVNSGKAIPLYSESNGAYVEITDKTISFIEKGFIMVSETDKFRGLKLHHFPDTGHVVLTKGDWEVDELIGIDEKNKLVYFTSTEESILERHLYSVDFSGKNKKKLTTGKGVHEITFSPTFEYYLDNHSSANIPPVITLRETATSKPVKVLTDNKPLKEKMTEYEFSQQEFFTFKTSAGQDLYASMLKPKDFDSTKKYPVLFTVYGGPGSQTVKESWAGANFAWYQLLAQKGYIIFSVDGRGTGGRGADFKKCTQNNLGKYETEDLIEAAKYLGGLKYIDKERIGIFGWSFGGYLSSLSITKGADYFKTAIAVAPVTNWRFYDNIYTERFLGKPQDNAKGYDENSPANYAKLLKGNYLLIHGTADDNVHVQNSFAMQDALIKANKQFEVFYYPNRNHSIYGGNTRFHLYKMMTDFIERKL